jgi:phosphatidate cytidylyltransferase
MNTAVLQQMSPELRKRVMTGVAGVAVLLLLIIFGGMIGIFLISTVISLAMIFEFSKVIYTLPDHEEKRYVLLFVAWFIALGALILAHSEYELLVFSFLGLFIYFLASARRNDNDLGQHFREFMFSIFGLLYLALLPTYFLKIHGSPSGVQWTILFLLVNWSNDTGAYFAGRKYGKTPLYPLISPKKTREGAIGGLVTGFVVSLIFKLLFFRSMAWGAVIFVPLLVGPVSQAGDLCESFFKRAFGVKDSGSILPGHGGFLDRFDGVVFSLPIMYACIRIFS